MFVIKILAVIFFLTFYIYSQDSTKQNISYTKLAVIGGVTAGGFIYGHALSENLWWKGEKSNFHFNWDDDWEYALGADKLGHFYFPYLVTNIYSQLFNWSGIDKKNSYLYAGVLALSYQTFIEVKDGFSKQWGFSWGDFTANVLGAAYPSLQNNFPELKNFNFKVSYSPSTRFKSNSHSTIIDDYESTYHWLSINVYNYLPESWKNFYPSFINIAVGHSVKHLDTGGKHEIYLALDWNLEELPGDFWLWKLVKRNLNYYHFPSPAVRLTPEAAWFGLKF